MGFKNRLLVVLCFILVSCYPFNQYLQKQVKVSKEPEIVATEEIKSDKKEVKKEVVVVQDEQKSIAEFKNSDVLKGSNWSFYAIDLNNKKVIAKYQEEKALTPASVFKILTSVTALEVLGADTRLETKLMYNGTVENGVLKGNLIIKGGGDPTLGSELLQEDKEKFLKTWVNTLKNLGIHSIQGDILVKDDLFGYSGVSDKWMLEDLGSNYGQGVYGINVFDNLYDITLDTSEIGKKPKILSITPKINELSLINNAIVDSRGRNNFVVRGLPFKNERELRGSFAQKNSSNMIQSDIPNPGLFLGEYFADYLKKSEIEFNGKVYTSRTEKISLTNAKSISVIKSPPIKEIVRLLLHKSDNLYTESLYNLITKIHEVDIYKYWKDKGFDVNALTISDGCGLSRSNTISTKFLVQLLEYSYTDIKSLLPTAGVNGNVITFLRTTPLKGKVFLKTGSMGGIQAYTGIVEKDNKRYLFSIIINHWKGSRTQLNKEIEKFLNNLF